MALLLLWVRSLMRPCVHLRTALPGKSKRSFYAHKVRHGNVRIPVGEHLDSL